MAKRNGTRVSRATKEKRYYHVGETQYAYELKENHFYHYPVAVIELKGHWLRDAGFPAGTPIEVQVEEGRLIVRPEIVAPEDEDVRLAEMDLSTEPSLRCLG